MAEASDIEYLKRITPEAVHSLYTDEALGEMIDADGVRGSARRLWEERVAQTAGFIDVKEGSSSRNLSQEHEHAKQMLALYGGEGSDGGRKGTRVHQIVREPTQ